MDNPTFKRTFHSTNRESLKPQEHKPGLFVSDFYRNAVVLITGGTGFVGKVLVEKLLRNFDVKKIYILLREKRNVSPPERLKELIKEPIFDTIRRTIIHHDALFAKLEAVDVDFTTDEFVKEPLKTDLLNNTQIVLHVMGNVSFSNGLQHSLETNVNSAERLYNFIRNAKNLQSIVHVSTFYSNCDRAHIEEVIYNDIPFGGLDNVRRILEPLSESESAALTPAILGALPNTYIFSKKCAEVMIQKQFSELPIGIFRPPIVGPSYQEPVAGWVDCFQSLTGLSMPILEHRFIRYYGDPNATSDIVPVDYCAAAIITSACDIRARFNKRKELESVDETAPSVPVYNFTFDKQRVTWKQFLSIVGSSLPSAIGRTLSPLRVRMTKRRILSQISFWLFYLQAYLADCILGMVKRPKCHVRTILSLDLLHQGTEYFLCHAWTSRNDNIKRMRSLLSKDEGTLLEFDVDRIDWNDYYKCYVTGLLSFLECKRKRRRERNKTTC